MSKFEAKKTVSVYGNKIYVCIKSSKISGSCNSVFKLNRIINNLINHTKRVTTKYIKIRLHVIIHSGNGDFPDHENNLQIYVVLVKISKTKKLAIFKIDSLL